MRGAVVLGAVALFVSVVSCTKKEGSSCSGAGSSCLDKESALVCRGGKLVRVMCGGVLGCTKFQDHANCDDSIANVGDACLGDDEYGCTPNKGRALLCKNGKYERWLECRGKTGCTQLGQQVQCDTSVAEKDDPCKTQGQTACTVNQKEMVICRDGKFIPYRFCRGQNGCSNATATPQCDESLSLEEDPCGVPGQIVCSVDGQNELVCQGGRYQKSLSCRKNGCHVTNRPGRPISCD